MSAAGRWDWDALMRLGLGALRLDAAAFWSMTPVEFQRALEGAGLIAVGGQAPDRAMLDALIAEFPDRPKEVGMRDHGYR